jgi:hypothetical protein
LILKEILIFKNQGQGKFCPCPWSSELSPMLVKEERVTPILAPEKNGRVAGDSAINKL